MSVEMLPIFSIKESTDACHRAFNEGCMKVSEDLDRYRYIIETTHPELVVECGTHKGGSAAWFAQQGLDVITVDLPYDSGVPYSRRREDNRGHGELVPNKSVQYLVGDSVDHGIYQQILSMIGGRRTMVSLDSNHDAEHVAKEIRIYSEMVSPGCYIVVEDGVLRWFPSNYVGNPLDAIESTLCTATDIWYRDCEVEGMSPVTLSPAGWWRRK